MAWAPSRCNGVSRELTVDGALDVVDIALKIELRRDIKVDGVADILEEKEKRPRSD